MWCLSKQSGHHWFGLLFSWGKLSSEQKSIFSSQIMPLPCSWEDGRGEVTESTIILKHSDSSPGHWAVGQERPPWSSLFSALMLILHSRSHSSLPWCSSYTPVLLWGRSIPSNLSWLPPLFLILPVAPWPSEAWTLLKWLSQNFFWLSDPRVYLCLPSRWWFYNPGAACWSFSLGTPCTTGYHWITCLGGEPVLFCWPKAHHRRMSGGLPFTSCGYGQEGSGRAK